MDTDDLFLWLQMDEPELAVAIATRDLKEQLERRVSSLVNLMRRAESNVYVMKAADIHDIIAHDGEPNARLIFRTFVSQSDGLFPLNSFEPIGPRAIPGI